MGKVMSNQQIKKEYYPDGNLAYECYYLNGKIHRENGPAFIYYYKNGNIGSESHYINGKYLTEEEWYSRLTTKQKVNILYGEGNEVP
jgi:antitoxin component YwqK of YwqJK toxin-antitoxin module